MTKILEINGFFSFCQFLARHPEEIIKNEELEKLLDFCFKAVSNCNCSEKDKDEAILLNEEFEKRMLSLPENQINNIGNLFCSGGDYSEGYVVFPNSNNKIKIK